MDKRLELTLTDIVSPQQARTLCSYAVLCARQDLGVTEPDEMMSYSIAVHLGRVIHLGFSGGWDTYPIPHDIAAAKEMFDQYALPNELYRHSRQLGDRCLFLYSQADAPEHPIRVTGTPVDVLGRYGYMVAAANAFGWSDFNRRLLTRIRDRFIEYGQLLNLAGTLLGFTPISLKLVAPNHPMVTIDDFLEALHHYGRNPTRHTWHILKQAVEDHKWFDPEFSFDLPAEPTE